MSLSRVEFALFFPAVLLLHWLLPRRTAWQNGFVLAVSYFFYWSWNPRLLPLLLIATAVDYFAALAIAKRQRPRLALAVSLAYNLGQLALFKYAGFFADSLNELFSAAGLPASLPVLKLALPLGISFWTLQKIGYILDVYSGAIEPCRSPLAFATFVAFFPQQTAGPIPRAHDLLPQFEAPRALRPDQARAGAGAFLLGFVKKAYAADYLAQYVVDPVFANPAGHTVLAHWAALLGYTAQIYCDFSGYSDMALGCGRLLGVELPQNFTHPFLSRSVRELWQRWHISLNTWLFDYIYGPLVASDGFWRGRLDLGFMLVFLASGLWHGAQWTFVSWGALNGLALIVHRRWDEHYRGLCRKDRSWVARRQTVSYQATAWFLTQGFFVLSLVPFRAPSLSAAATFARGLLSSAGTDTPNLASLNVAMIGLFLVVYHLLALPRGRMLWERFLALPPVARGVAYGIVVAYLFVFSPAGSGAFIYARF